MQHRIGIGHDTHRLEPGGPLMIGGVEIEFEFHLAGHSDADVLLHAITDAILGAAAMGDIGELFPDNAAENKGCLLYTSPSPRDRTRSRMPSSA